MHLARTFRAVVLALAACGALLPAPAVAQDRSDAPRASSVRERVDVRMVQVVVSVVDREVSEFASVPDIPPGDFLIKLDGKPLTPEQQARTVIDRMCERTKAPTAVEEALGRQVPERPIILLVDFNYLDALGRHNVARTLRRAAETVADSGAAYKVYGYTRDLEILTPTKSFVSDPHELLVAAERVERTIYTRRGAEDFDLAEDAETSFSEGSPSQGDSSGTTSQVGPLESGAPGTTEAIDRALDNSLFDELELESDFNPTASLGAIERLMIIHATIPWLKTVVLFTSETFGFADPAKEERAIHELLDRRTGYRFWPVIADGLADDIEAVSGRFSRIVSSLAGNTGGHTTRRTADLHRAIEGATEQLSCYYLVSVPVTVTEDDQRFKLTVQLDREGKDEETADRYFRYRVDWDRKTIAFRNPVERQRELRMAALFSPDDFTSPPLSVTLDYPEAHAARDAEGESDRARRRGSRRGPAAELTVRLRLRLADLDWSPLDDAIPRLGGRFEARFVPALVVEQHDARGVRVLCEFDADREKPFRTREFTVPLDGGRPNERDPLAVSVEYTCPLDKVPEGLYVARGIVTDVGSGRIAAGKSSVYLHERDVDEWMVLSARMETVTSREILWDASTRRRRWDRGRKETWRVMESGEAARADDRLALRYTLCGPDGEEPAGRVAHALFRVRDDRPALEFFLGRGLLRVGEALDAGRRSFCPQAELVLEPYTLTEPGEYFVVAYRADLPAGTLLETVETTAPVDLGAADGVLAAVPFTVAD